MAVQFADPSGCDIKPHAPAEGIFFHPSYFLPYLSIAQNMDGAGVLELP